MFLITPKPVFLDVCVKFVCVRLFELWRSAIMFGVKTDLCAMWSGGVRMVKGRLWNVVFLLDKGEIGHSHVLVFVVGLMSHSVVLASFSFCFMWCSDIYSDEWWWLSIIHFDKYYYYYYLTWVLFTLIYYFWHIYWQLKVKNHVCW